jgi:hypothetical protein
MSDIKMMGLMIDHLIAIRCTLGIIAGILFITGIYVIVYVTVKLHKHA